MDTIQLKGFGEFPARRAETIQKGEKIIFEDCNSAIVESVTKRDKSVEFSLRDSLTNTLYIVRKMNYNMVGVLCEKR